MRAWVRDCAHHMFCTFFLYIFSTLFNLVGKGSGHAQTTRGYMAERQSPGGNKRPWGTPLSEAGKASS